MPLHTHTQVPPADPMRSFPVRPPMGQQSAFGLSRGSGMPSNLCTAWLASFNDAEDRPSPSLRADNA
jgi:hypothetical protein